MLKTQFGYYGLRVKPTFDDVLDAANKPLRIPLPDRAAKRKAYSLFRNKVLDNERLAMGYDPAGPGQGEAGNQTHDDRMGEIQRLAAAHDIQGLEHALSGDTIPAAVLQVAPSSAADDAVWTEMLEHSKQHFESKQQQAIRHRVDEESMEIMRGERYCALHDAHSQGRGHPMLQGEVPIDVQMKTEIAEAPGVAGRTQRILVPRAAPHQMPRATGFPAVREFATFRELNMGQVRETGKRTGHVDFTKQGDSYETFRRATNTTRENLW
jgi:hypothetical protein